MCRQISFINTLTVLRPHIVRLLLNRFVDVYRARYVCMCVCVFEIFTLQKYYTIYKHHVHIHNIFIIRDAGCFFFILLLFFLHCNKYYELRNNNRANIIYICIQISNCIYAVWWTNIKTPRGSESETDLLYCACTPRRLNTLRN